jgi:type VI secretion system VasD/TssJ family lipoprotein
MIHCKKYNWLIALFYFVGLIIWGCASHQGLAIKGSDDQNSGGHPVVIHIYQLSSDTNFNRAVVESFWQDDTNILGDDLVKPKIEILLAPGEIKRLKLKLSDEIKFIGIAADFRNPDKNGWRKVYPIDSNRAKNILINVASDRLIVEEI